jgi:hypothetical protein
VTLDPHHTENPAINTSVINPQAPVAVLALILAACSGMFMRDEPPAAAAAPAPAFAPALPGSAAGWAEPVPSATGGAVLHAHALRADGH